MIRRVEIKARIANFQSFLVCAQEISGMDGEVTRQKDTFFNCPNGKLKLRKQQEGEGQLIFYRRSDNTIGPTVSEFRYVDINNPGEIENILHLAYGIKGKVNKTRTRFLVGTTRIHADDVDHLGTFMELEVPIKEEQNVEEGQKIVKDLMARLGVSKDALVTRSYLDHIVQSQGQNTNVGCRQ